jgi:hypothetical protein
MSEKRRRQPIRDPIVEAALGLDRDEPEERPGESEQKEEPERKPTPHETKRKRRQMSVTFPTPEWREVVKDQAEAWDMRPSDFVLYCVSQTMRGVEDGTVQRPPGKVKTGEIYHRTGGTLELPWEPS